MQVEIKKHQSTASSKGHKMSGCAYFRVKLPGQVREILGREIKVKKHETHYELTKFGSISEGRPMIINQSNWLTLNLSLIEEYEDLGFYDVVIETESESVNLVRV